MASQRTKRAIRAGLSVTAATAALFTSVPGPALALPLTYQQPPPPETASEALAQYEKLTSQAEQVNEDLLAAKTDLDKKKAALAKANQDLAAAKAAQGQAAADEEAFRGQVDNLTNASFQGARFNKLSALLTGSSAEDFLERASALGVLAADNEEALAKLTSAVNLAEDAKKKAADAQKRATDATAAAQALTDKVAKARDDLNAQIEQVEDAYEELSGADQDALMGETDNSIYLGGPGVGGEAARHAMTQRGKMYLWAAEGPDRYDCSGLTLWAYRQVGITLPHSSRAQYGYGKSVAQGQWQPGDLLFYGSSAGSIHHVAMYIGDGMLVHASQSGTPVQTAEAPYGGGKDYLGAKRIAG
ncbi:C40 family peptidase [Actinophytocola glycyrrhizae]|uniref:C40 family peptidase n=1 Tax=Actinophytocola glycyrrhizae TaxID=2044873 RepID=A0ABV9S9Q3_9PSEU